MRIPPLQMTIRIVTAAGNRPLLLFRNTFGLPLQSLVSGRGPNSIHFLAPKNTIRAGIKILLNAEHFLWNGDGAEN